MIWGILRLAVGCLVLGYGTVAPGHFYPMAQHHEELVQNILSVPRLSESRAIVAAVHRGGPFGPDHCNGGAPFRYVELAYEASRKHWPVERWYLWCTLVAQAKQESQFGKYVVSPVGAEGPYQFMPGTWEEYGAGGDPYDLEDATEAVAKYRAALGRIFLFDRTEECRTELELASYNSGQGSVLKAQRLSGGAQCWGEIGRYQRAITGHHADETLTYVANIVRYWEEFTGGEWGS